MGSSLSKSKTFDVPKQQSNRFSCSTSSSERTMVEPESNNKKPSILTKHNFFRTKKTTVKSLSKRKHYKRKSVVVTKSIIGRPTNFKHLNSSTHMDNDDETAKIAAQMIILSSLIKPLPIEGNIPIIPPRSSSYSNHIYAKEHPIPATTTPSIKKKKKMVGMKNSVPRRRVQVRAANKMS